MTEETITLSLQVPTVNVVARIVEVSCGDSRVTLRQVMGVHDQDWTVYEGDAFDAGRNKGLVGKIEQAPTVPTMEELVPWAADLVTRRERARLASVALRREVDNQPHRVQDHEQPAPDPD